MNIIYLSASCSERKFEELRSKGITQKLPQAQKYHRLLMEGIAQNDQTVVNAITAIPVTRSGCKKAKFSHESESINGIQYYYCGFLNFLGLRQVSLYFESIRQMRKYTSGVKDETVIVCDILNQSLATAALRFGKKNKVPVVGIVTDVPGHTSGARIKTASKFKQYLAKFINSSRAKSMHLFDGYLFLTEAMNSVVNKLGKPYIVIEGHADIGMTASENKLEDKKNPKVMMYAGGIHKEFGIATLVNAFLKGNYEDWTFDIYGDGNYQNELRDIAANNQKVNYYGVQPNARVVDAQMKASLLVNPRLTDAEYVKYSFPSKTLECMVSGTPLLTTKLPGMPKEYYDYVYLFYDESEDGFLRVLSMVLNTDPVILHKKGMEAKEFAVNNKNNVSQAKKFCTFLGTIVQQR